MEKRIVIISVNSQRIQIIIAILNRIIGKE